MGVEQADQVGREGSRVEQRPVNVEGHGDGGGFGLDSKIGWEGRRVDRSKCRYAIWTVDPSLLLIPAAPISNYQSGDEESKGLFQSPRGKVKVVEALR